jgi:hypothetical protein
MKTRLLAAALLLSLAPAVVLPPRAAFAQGDEATTKMARQRFQEGVSYYDKHDYELARAAFLQAYALHKHPAVLLNLAQSSLKSGHALEASRYFQQFLREYTGATAAQHADAEAGLADARTHIGRIDVSSAPSGAEILVDGESIGVAPFDHPLDVEPGSHTVKAHGHGDETVTVICSAGSVVTARFTASTPPPAVAPVPTPPPAEEPPPAAAEPTPAPPPEAAAPAPAAFEASSSPGLFSPPAHIAPVIVGTVVTLAAFGTAIAFSIEKSSAQSAANDEAAKIVANGGKAGTCVNPQPPFPGPCSTLAGDNSNVNTDALIGNVAVGVGVAAAVFTVGYYLFAWKGDGEAAPAPAATTGSSTFHPVFAPLIGKGTGGMSLGASF